MKKRCSAIFLAVVMVAAMVMGCSTGTGDSADTASQKQNAPKKNGKYTIGCTVYYMTEFVTLMSDGMKKKADQLGCGLIMLDAQQDAQKQITQVENLIAQKVDAIIVAAVDSDAILPAMDMCKKAGIPLIGVNMLFNTDKPYYYVGPNDVLAGELEMQHAIDKIGGKGNVVILEGPIGQSAQLQRLEGNKKVLDKYKGKVNVLAEQTANWSREEALTMTENWLQTFNGKIDAIVAHNDEMALGAIQALEAQKLTGKIVVTGVDAILDGCNAVKDGSLLGTVYQDAGLEGSDAVERAYDVLEGKVTKKELSYIDMKWITKDNVDDLLNTIYKGK